MRVTEPVSAGRHESVERDAQPGPSVAARRGLRDSRPVRVSRRPFGRPVGGANAAPDRDRRLRRLLFSSIEHATNAGRIFRPSGEPLFPNYRWLPVAYHGRASTVVVSGTGDSPALPARRSSRADQRRMGFRAERATRLRTGSIGFITGPGNPAGSPIPTRDAAAHIFGFVLLNDWSARDLQSWETQPLGPFLGKSFATSISPWIVAFEALAPYRVGGRIQDPPPLPHLRVEEPWAFDLELEVAIETRRMRESGQTPSGITRVNFRNMYWNAAQQLAHLTSNGTVVRPGDLYGSRARSPGDQAGHAGQPARGGAPRDAPHRAGRRRGPVVVGRRRPRRHARTCRTRGPAAHRFRGAHRSRTAWLGHPAGGASPST